MDRSRIWDKLDESLEEFRVIRLLPSSIPTAPLRLQLEVVSLQHPPTYEAVSYVWGDPEDTRNIMLNNQHTKITTNLHAGLLRFRRRSRVRTLWVDAICINQTDLGERARQVRMMAKVYSTAVVVNVWLGEPVYSAWKKSLWERFRQVESEVQEVGDLLWKDGYAEIAVEQTLEHLTTTLSPPSEEAINNRSSPLVLGVCMLATNPWFSRVWVIQEVALARFTELYCGRHRCSTKSLEQFALSMFDAVKKLEGAANGVKRMFYLALSVGIADMETESVFRQSFRSKEALDIMDTCGSKECTDDRDRVYGLLNLTRLDGRIVVDYTKNVRSVYIDAAAAILSFQPTLELLLRPRGETSTDRLPSWVPDWRACKFGSGSHVRATAWQRVFDHHYACAGVLSIDDLLPTGPLGNGELLIKACIVDEIKFLGRAATDEDYLPSDKRNCHWKLLGDWRSFLQVTDEIFWNVVGKGLWRSRDPRSQQPSVLRRLTAEDCRATEKTFQDGDDHFQSVDSAEGAVDTVGGLTRVKPSISLLGRPGQVPAAAEIGDVVAILPGGRVPFLLRTAEADTNRYQLVGPCYIYGMMEGEVLWECFDAQASDEQQKKYHEEADLLEQILEGDPEADDVALYNELDMKYLSWLFKDVVLV